MSDPMLGFIMAGLLVVGILAAWWVVEDWGRIIPDAFKERFDQDGNKKA